MRQAIRTAAPVGDLGFVDLVALVVARGETRRVADGAVDVDDAAADAADQVMVVVADAILVASRRPGGLDAADETLRHEDAKGVIHGLQRDGADFGPHGLGHGVRGDVGATRYRPEDGQSLGGDLNPAFTKLFDRVGGHGDSLDQRLE